MQARLKEPNGTQILGGLCRRALGRLFLHRPERSLAIFMFLVHVCALSPRAEPFRGKMLNADDARGCRSQGCLEVSDSISFCMPDPQTDRALINHNLYHLYGLLNRGPSSLTGPESSSSLRAVAAVVRRPP